MLTKNARLEEKVTQLEKKLIRLDVLENKVQQQESLIIAMNNERQMESVSTSGATTKFAIFRTCREVRAADPTLASGMLWIDPDGQGIGEDPIYVYCNMATGIKIIIQ